MNRLLAAFALVLTLQAIAVQAMPTGVLCVSEGGHVAFETPSAACCDTDSHAAEPSPARIDHGAGGDCCGPCTDVAWLDPPKVASRGAEFSLATAVPTWTPLDIALGCLISSRPTESAAHALRSVPEAKLSLTALRTIVLTC